MADQIDTLRAIRDVYLLDNVFGTAFVDLYYRLSPPVADIVAGSPVLAATVRLLLVPVVALSKLALNAPYATLLLAASAVWVHRRRRKTKRT